MAECVSASAGNRASRSRPISALAAVLFDVHIVKLRKCRLSSTIMHATGMLDAMAMVEKDVDWL